MCELDVFALCIEIVTFVATIIVLVFALVPIFRDGDRKKLKEQLDKSDSLTRDLTSMKNQLIFLLLKTNNIDNMDDEFINQIKDIDDSRIQNNCGIYYLKKSRSVSENKNHLLQTALKHLTKALDLSKGKEEIKREIIYVNLADAYDDLDQKDKAYRCCKSARKVNEECGQAFNMLASLELTDGNLSDAQEHALQAIRFNKENGFAYLTLAETYFRDFDESEDQKSEIKDNIKQALENGCPVWDYWTAPIYDSIKAHTEFWNECKSLISEYQKDYHIADMRIQCEHEYLL